MRCLRRGGTLDERGRFDVPGSAQEAGDDYRNDLDGARGFVLEECNLDGDGFAVQSKLYTAYRIGVRQRAAGSSGVRTSTATCVRTSTGSRRVRSRGSAGTTASSTRKRRRTDGLA